MPMPDFLKSAKQKKEDSDFKLFNEKSKIEDKIDILQDELKKLEKKALNASPKDEDELVSQYRRTHDDLVSHEEALDEVNKLISGVGDGVAGSDSLDSILDNIVVELAKRVSTDVAKRPKREDVKRAEMILQGKLTTTPSKSGRKTLGRLTGHIRNDGEDHVMSSEDARAKLFGSKTDSNSRILARMAEIKGEMDS